MLLWSLVVVLAPVLVLVLGSLSAFILVDILVRIPRARIRVQDSWSGFLVRQDFLVLALALVSICAGPGAGAGTGLGDCAGVAWCVYQIP